MDDEQLKFREVNKEYRYVILSLPDHISHPLLSPSHRSEAAADGLAAGTRPRLLVSPASEICHYRPHSEQLDRAQTRQKVRKVEHDPLLRCKSFHRERLALSLL